MAEHESPQDTLRAAGAQGVFASLRAVLVTVLAIAGTRFELIGIEVAEEKERLVAIAVTGFAAAFAMSFAILLLTLFFVVWFWDTHRLVVIGGFTMLYFAAGAWSIARLRAQLDAHPALFAATVAELEKDRDTLRSAMKQDAAAGERA